MRSAAIAVVETLVQAGHQAVFAGGCVRDMLRGAEPKDYDIATSARPDEVAKLFPGSHAVGAHFGVVIVVRDGHPVEVATFRRDGKYSDARHPDSVEFSDAREDARRRDFTVNGLFFDPLRNEVLDYVGGREDLERRILRAIGDPRARLGEDHLRLLRAVRFAAVLDFAIEEETYRAVCELSGAIRTVSVERIRMELEKILLHPNRVRGFDLLVETGLMAAILPEILLLRGCEQPPQFHPEGDVFVHTRIMLGLLPPDAPLPLVLAVLLHDIAKPATSSVDETGRIRFNGHDKLGARMTGDILRRLKFPNQVVEPVADVVANHMVFKDVQQMRVARLKRFLARPTIEMEMELHRVDCASSHAQLDNYEFLRARQAEFAAAPEPLIPRPLINGHDLIALGFKPGPRMRELLTGVQNLQLEGAVSTREEALEWAARQPR